MRHLCSFVLAIEGVALHLAALPGSPDAVAVVRHESAQLSLFATSTVYRALRFQRIVAIVGGICVETSALEAQPTAHTADSEVFQTPEIRSSHRFAVLLLSHELTDELPGV